MLWSPSTSALVQDYMTDVNNALIEKVFVLLPCYGT